MEFKEGWTCISLSMPKDSELMMYLTPPLTQPGHLLQEVSVKLWDANWDLPVRVRTVFNTGGKELVAI